MASEGHRSCKVQESWEPVLASWTPTSPLGAPDNTDTLHELNPKSVQDKLFPYIVHRGKKEKLSHREQTNSEWAPSSSYRTLCENSFFFFFL